MDVRNIPIPPYLQERLKKLAQSGGVSTTPVPLIKWIAEHEGDSGYAVLIGEVSAEATRVADDALHPGNTDFQKGQLQSLLWILATLTVEKTGDE